MSIYQKAWNILEKADRRKERSPDYEVPHDTNYFATKYWTKEKKAAWERDDRQARLLASQAITDAQKSLGEIQRMVEKAKTNREYAKAVAARIEMTYAIWEEAYARHMAKTWGTKK